MSAGRSAFIAALSLATIALCRATAEARQTAGDATPASTFGNIGGLVYDSIARAPLRGVAVDLISAPDDAGRPRAFSATADSAGRYSFVNVPPGRYLIGFFNLASDTLGIEAPGKPVTVNPGSQRVDLAIPSPRTVIRSMCPGWTAADSTGLLIGHVLGSDDSAPLEGAAVTVEWTETLVQGVLIEDQTRQISTATRGPGWFAICDLPSDVVLTARANRGADSSGYVLVQVPVAGLRHLTVRVGGARLLPRARPVGRSATDSGLTVPVQTVLRGGAKVSGTVRDEKGKPVANARALVWGTDLEAITNSRGVFVLDSLPGGSHTLEVRHIRYSPAHAMVQLAASRPATADIALTERAVTLSTVTVRGQLTYSRNLSGFEARRQEGWEQAGQFLGPADIEKRPNARLASLLQDMVGVYVDNRRGGGTVRMRAPGNGQGISYCTPSLYVDGVRDMDADFNDFDSNGLAAVEVYPREAGRPSEFMDGNACGSIIVWTRTSAAKMKDPPS